MTIGLDGSVWLANGGTPSNTVQQVKQINGVWIAQSPIEVGLEPWGITTGLDGSIWVANTGSNTVQQISNDQGQWIAQPAIGLGFGVTYPYAMANAPDGSIWVSVGYDASSAVQQILNTEGKWIPQKPISTNQDVSSISFAPDGSIWLSCLGESNSIDASSLQQIVKINGVWTPQTGITIPSLPNDVVVTDDGSIFVAMPDYQGAIIQIGGDYVPINPWMGINVPSFNWSSPQATLRFSRH